MKHRFSIALLIAVLAGTNAFSQLTVKDPDSNILMQVNDEGKAGSITIPDTADAPTTTDNKLYNLSGSLYWNGSAVGIAGSADGDWTVSGGNLYSAVSGNVGIGDSSPSFKLDVTGKIGINDTQVLYLTSSGSNLFLGTGGNSMSLGEIPPLSVANSGLGMQALESLTTGFYNTAVGLQALMKTTVGNNNTAVGLGAGLSNTTGSSNTILGSYAGYYNSTGSYNTIIGYGAGLGSSGSNHSGNVFIGYQAGNSETGSNKLYIENSNSSTPLIGGDFSNDEIYLNGKVGIGTSDPEFSLSLSGDGGILAEGSSNNGAYLTATGTGVRLIWYPRKGAFRAGMVTQSTYWDDDSIGTSSAAFGNSTRATNSGCFATGNLTVASGIRSTAMGDNSVASGVYSTAIGLYAAASDTNTTSIGAQTTASAAYATAIGGSANATGRFSTAIGQSISANGDYSNAYGTVVTANGSHSTAMGNRVSISGDGSFIIGDYSTTTSLSESTDNRFFARFENGYKLYTNSTATVGVEVGAGGNSWTSISDSTKKENVRPVDGEDVLEKISAFRLGTWNYIGQDPAKHRHYGPMAQDFFTAFGRDEMGVIGNDTTLSSADFDGINFIAVQALEKRTSQQKEELEALKAINARVLAENKGLRQELTELKTLVAHLIDERKEPDVRMTSAQSQ